MHHAYRKREEIFAGVMDDRAAWEQATAQQRRLAVAADAELRRRHPDQRFEPLRSAEPEPVTTAEREELTLTTGEEHPEMGHSVSAVSMSSAEVTRTRWVNRALKLPAGPYRPAGRVPGRIKPTSRRPAGLGWIMANCFLRRMLR
jgi:hypothetical protein